MAALVASLVVMAEAPAVAHGEVDQQLVNPDGSHPDCASSDLPGTRLLDSPLRQSFVPTRGGLASLDLCFAVLVAGSFRLNVYEGGTAASPDGAPIATRDVSVSGLGDQWVHVDLDLDATTAGIPYVIETEGLSITARWRASCSGGLLGGSCDPGQPDRYPDGNTNSSLGPNADFGFRSYPLFDADLIGSVDAPGVVCPGLDVTGSLTGAITNESQTSVGPFAVDYYLSSDTALDEADTLLPDSRVSVPGLAPGETIDASPATSIPSDAASGRAYVLQVVDADDDVVEASDGEGAANVFGDATAVTGCGPADIPDLTLTAESAEVPAGLRSVPMDLLPAEVLAETSGLKYGGLKYGGLKYGDINFGGLKHGGLKYGGLKYGDINFSGLKHGGLKHGGLKHGSIAGHDLTTLLRQIPEPILDASLLIDVPGTDWSQYFDGPIQDRTLLDVREADLGLPLSAAVLDHVIELTWFSVAYSTTTLEDVGVDCGFLADHGLSCAEHDIDPAVDTLVTIDALGFPMDALGQIDLTLANTTLRAASPFLVARLTGDGRYVIEASPFGNLLLGGDDPDLLDPNVVIDCSQGSICDTGTLREAVAVGAVRDVDVAALVGQLTPAAKAAINLHDAVNGLRPDNAWPWLPAILGLDHAVLGQDHPDRVDACTPVTYHLTGTSTGGADLVDPEFTVSLPWTFRYLPGTGQLTSGSTSVTADASTVIDDEGRQHLTFPTTAIVEDAFDLAFQACGGHVLGPWTADASASGEDTTGPWSFTANDQAPVTTTQLGEPDGCDNAVLLDPDVAYVGHLDGQDDVDCLQVPVEAGSGLFVLQPPPGVDYDVTAYGPAIDPLDTAGLKHGGLKHGGLKHGGALDPVQPVPDGDTPQGDDRDTMHTDRLQDAGLKHGPADSSGVEATSHLRGNAVEFIEVEAQEGEQGVRSFAVFSFGGTSPLPFVASFEPMPDDTDLPGCVPAPQDEAGVRGTAPDPSDIPSDPDTLFLVNRIALGEQYGPEAADDAIEALRTLAQEQDPDFEVRGIVLEVDGDDDVFAADRAWRTGDNWCSVVAANDVAEAVQGLVETYRAEHPSIRNLVIAGPDTSIPGLRVPDGATLASQRAYLGELLKATDGNNPLVAAAAADTYVVDAALAAEPTTPWENGALHLPGPIGVSRVVETPDDIVASVAQFFASDGLLDPATAFTSSYDFMEDGSQAASDVLSGEGIAVTELFSDTWTAADQASFLDDGHPLLRPDGHSDHFQQLSANGSLTADYDDVNTSSVIADLPLGGMVLSMGCNFGLNVPDTLTDPADPEQVERRQDWMQAIGKRRAVAFANTGFGYGDDETIALDERLLLDLTERLHTTENISHALSEAQHEYVATMGAYGPHDKKAVETMTGFGLGLYSVAGAEPSADPPPTTPVSDPETGLASASISGSYTVVDNGHCEDGSCLVRRVGTDGSVHYGVEGEDSVPLAVSGQFLTPQSNRTLNVAGHRPGGVWPTQRTTELRVVDDATVAFKTVSRSEHEPAPDVADRAFPVTPGRANESLRDLQTTAVPLAFTRTNGRQDTDTDRTTVVLTTGYTATVYQVPVDVELHKPEILGTTVVSSGSGIGITTRARDQENDIVRCGAWIVDRAGTSHYAELTPDAAARDVTCTGYLPDVDDAFFAHVLALDAVGNVAASGLKGLDPLEVAPSENGVTFALPAPDGDNGWYLSSPVEVGITGPPDIPLTVFLDHRELTDFSGTVSVTGSGLHRLVVTGEGVFGQLGIPLDVDDPQCTDLPGGSHPAGTTLVATWSCDDRGSGIAAESATFDGTPVAKGDELHLDTAGTYTFEVVARDHAGRTTTATSTIEVTALYRIDGPLKPLDGDSLNEVTAGETLPVKFRVHSLEDGTEQTSTEVVRGATWTPVDCTSRTTLGSPVEARSKPAFRYADGHFIFNAVTEKKWKADECFRFTVTLVDGTSMTVDVLVT